MLWRKSGTDNVEFLIKVTCSYRCITQVYLLVLEEFQKMQQQCVDLLEAIYEPLNSKC